MPSLKEGLLVVGPNSAVDFTQAMGEYQKSKRLFRSTPPNSKMNRIAAFNMEVAELKIIALGGSLKAAGVPFYRKNIVTKRMKEARAKLETIRLVRELIEIYLSTEK